jgi:hypothetical protein
VAEARVQGLAEQQQRAEAAIAAQRVRIERELSDPEQLRRLDHRIRDAQEAALNTRRAAEELTQIDVENEAAP